MGNYSGGPLLIGIDLGTTACKSAIFSRDGRILALSYREYPFIKISAKRIEQNAEEWWTLITDTIKECLSTISDSDKKNIKAIGISAQGITFVPVDKKGAPVANAITWLDSRADEEALELADAFGMEEIYLKTGVQAIPVYMLPKIMWLKKNRPDIYERAYRFCTCQDFLTSRLAGRYITDYSIAGGSLIHDVQKLEWSEELLNMAQIPKEKLPELDWAGNVAGPITKKLAGEFGIPEDTLVVLGGHDQECAGIGAGLQFGNMTISFGTASIILASIDKPLFDKLMRIPCLPSVEKDKWVMEGVVSIGGAGLRWIRDFINGFSETLCNQGMQVPSLDYEQLVGIAEKVEIGESEVLFFSHMTGATSPYWLPSATGVFHGISLSTTMPHIVKAVIEGWIFQIKTNLLVLKELTYDPEEVIIFGGGAKSRFIGQLTADILNKPVIVPDTTETALLGAGILAGIGSGVYKDVPSAQKEVIRQAERIEPIMENVQKYSAIYEKFIKIEKFMLDSTI